MDKGDRTTPAGPNDSAVVASASPTVNHQTRKYGFDAVTTLPKRQPPNRRSGVAVLLPQAQE